MTDSVPEKLGKYKIIEEVGRGGFAAVYKAVDTTLDRTVALKVLASHLLWDPTFVQRFQREAKVAANLDHPNIVTIYEVSQIEGVYFIAMQFLEGRTLSQILKAVGPLPVSGVQAIIEQIASALDYAHARGLVHRDIKPSNIIVARDGKVTLTDFGLVKAGEGTQLTATGVVFGTPEYMSPEQAEGKKLDAQSDIYSLGVVLYEVLAGRAPFVADTTPAVMYKHVHEPPPLEELPSDLPQGVVAVVEKALAKKREERYQSAGEMAQALQEATEARVKVVPIPPEPEIPVAPPVVKKEPEVEKVAPPLVEPVAVAKEEPAPLPRPKRAVFPSLLVIAIGWAIGWAIVIALGGDDPEAINWAGWAVGGAIGGLSTGLALRRTEPPIPWNRVLMIVVGWAIDSAIGWPIVWESDDIIVGSIVVFIIGAIGGLITGLALWWAEPPISWKRVLIVAIGWAIGMVIGLVGLVLVVSVISADIGLHVAFAIYGAIAGAIGGGVMFWQLSLVRRKA
ncbi:MAG: protein kinase [Anaerolineae bacterium]|nr:protein kinase [Anaerolineae bacterium]